MNILLTLKKALFTLLIATASLQAATVSDIPSPGQIHFMMRTWTNFDAYTHNSSAANHTWLQQHMWRMQESYGYFDPELSWYPNAWAYVDSSACHTNSAIVSQHPDWILKDSNGNKLYVPFNCHNGACSQYAMDFGNQAYRNWWISMAQSAVNRGYKGLWIDDVNFEERTSDGSGKYVQPIDPHTGKLMPIQGWRRYFADFMVQVRQAMPNIEILHNQIFWDGAGLPGTDPDVQREIKSANYINRERGVSIGIDGPGTNTWGLRSYLGFADQVHALGSNVDIQEFDFSGDYGPACYFLVSDGMDAFGNDAITPNNWPANYDVDLGSPQGSRYEWSGFIRRDFTKGSVFVVAPGDPAAKASIGSGYKDVSGKAVSTVSLGAKQGLILLKTATVAPPPQTGQPLPDGAYTIKNLLSGLVLDDPGGSLTAGTKVVQWGGNGGSNQKWNLAYDATQGAYMISNVVASQLYLSDIAGQVTEEYQNSVGNQYWTLQPVSGGYALRNKNTGKVMDDPGKSTANGTAIITWSANGVSNQTWSLQ